MSAQRVVRQMLDQTLIRCHICQSDRADQHADEITACVPARVLRCDTIMQNDDVPCRR